MIVSCSSSDSSQDDDQYANEDKVLIYSYLKVSYVGLDSGKIYKQLWNYRDNDASKDYYNKADDKIYRFLSNIGYDRLEVIDAKQFRIASNATEVQTSSLVLHNIDNIDLTSQVFSVEPGFLHVIYYTEKGNTFNSPFGVGKINLSTGNFQTIHSSYSRPFSSSRILYNPINHFLYHFNNAVGDFDLIRKVDMSNGANQSVNFTYNISIDLYSNYWNTFQNSIDQNFYFFSSDDNGNYLVKIDATTNEMVNMGKLPESDFRAGNIYFINAKNKVVFSVFNGSTDLLGSKDYNTGVEKKVIIQSIQGNIIFIDRLLFID
jgi:hypothetical protein